MSLKLQHLQNIPIIITREKVIFPSGKKDIDARRKKSLLAIKEAIKNFKNFIVVVAQKNPEEDNPTLSDIHKVGTLCVIDEKLKQKTENTSLISVTGIKRVFLKKVNDLNDYCTADIEIINSKPLSLKKNEFLINKINENLHFLIGHYDLVYPLS